MLKQSKSLKNRMYKQVSCDFMGTVSTTILLICSTLFYSCGDRKNIIVTGQITDELTGQPVANAEVVVLCWYAENIDDDSFNKQTLSTDKNGNYKANFHKGHKVDVASKSKDYQPNRSYNNLSDNEIQVNLKLSKSKNNRTLITSFNKHEPLCPFYGHTYGLKLMSF